MLTSFFPFKRRLMMTAVVCPMLIALLAAEGAAASRLEMMLQQSPEPEAADVPVFSPSPAYMTLSVMATGYTAGAESTGKRPGHPDYGITYSGVKVRRDIVSTIAADPKVLPIGTLLYVPDYGYAVVADTGGKIKGNKIDLYFETTKQVYSQWGKKKVTVHVLKKGEGKLTEAWLEELNRAVLAEKRIPERWLKS